MAKNIDRNKSQLEFTGKLEFQPQAGELDPETQEPLYPYLADVSDGLVEAVQLAINLNELS
jgi:hypothetical protein